MSDEVIKMPNSIGQMDTFTDAAKAGELELALSILDTEIERRIGKFNVADLERKASDKSYYEAKTFRFNIAKGGETWNQCRRACGWNPDEPAEVKAAGPVVMRVEDLQRGDEVTVNSAVFWFDKIDSAGDFSFIHSVSDDLRLFYPEELRALIARGCEVHRTTDGVRALISGWPADKHPAVEEAARMNDSYWLAVSENSALASKNEGLENELKAAKAEVERLKAAADEPELDWSRVVQTTYELAGQPNFIRMPSGDLWCALRCIIRSIYSVSEPHFKPYKLKK